MVNDLLYDNIKLPLLKTSEGKFYQPRLWMETESHDNKVWNRGLILTVPSSVFNMYMVDAMISILTVLFHTLYPYEKTGF